MGAEYELPRIKLLLRKRGRSDRSTVDDGSYRGLHESAYFRQHHLVMIALSWSITPVPWPPRARNLYAILTSRMVRFDPPRPRLSVEVMSRWAKSPRLRDISPVWITLDPHPLFHRTAP